MEVDEKFAIHTETFNGGIEQGLLEIVGKDNLNPEFKKRLDYLQSLPRDRGITNDGKIVDLRTGEVISANLSPQPLD
ncbi:hypothetical protein [sulfur-oxidizing endosymbiont of Gigantopelta aegis]|uniref:hypothetical protein n=1 Tax=sulfur-oxidizing endosymbiont of Gigantopelta aegis TaxID=2794934 RepID=UPI0018DC7073|nr:hypothetical protein [sulfur-oxidizing endosymbiont of Gigantopelta aegis]